MRVDGALAPCVVVVLVAGHFEPGVVEPGDPGRLCVTRYYLCLSRILGGVVNRGSDTRARKKKHTLNNWEFRVI